MKTVWKIVQRERSVWDLKARSLTDTRNVSLLSMRGCRWAPSTGNKARIETDVYALGKKKCWGLELPLYLTLAWKPQAVCLWCLSDAIMCAQILSAFSVLFIYSHTLKGLRSPNYSRILSLEQPMWSLSSFNFLMASRKNYLRRDDCKSLHVVEHGLLERTCLMAQEMATFHCF